MSKCKEKVDISALNKTTENRGSNKKPKKRNKKLLAIEKILLTSTEFKNNSDLNYKVPQVYSKKF